jgi:hypothetical protein
MSKNEKNSRRAFLGSAIVVGGALYSEPAAALANVGGRTFGGVEPDTTPFPGNTPLSKLVDGIPGKLGNLTLSQLGGLAKLEEKTLVKLFSGYDLAIADVQSLLTAIQSEYGTGPILTRGSQGYSVSCCSCSCCCLKVTFPF